MLDSNFYDKLLKFQNILTEKFKLQDILNELPKLINSKIEVLNRSKKSYLTKHKSFKKYEENVIAIEKKINELRLEQMDLNEKVKVVKTQKEYEAIDKMLKNLKEREEELLIQLTQDKRLVEDLKSSIEDFEISIKQQEEEINKEQERVNLETNKINKELKELLKQEEEILNDIDPDFRSKFERIVKNKDGRGIVKIIKMHCDGCNLILPPEYINRVRSKDKIYFCPNCSRVLYFDESPDNIFTIDDEFMSDDDFFVDEEE